LTIPSKEKSENLSEIEVESTKHRKTLQGNHETNITMFYSNFPIMKEGDHCFFSLSNIPFHASIMEIKVFLMAPQAFLARERIWEN
jgi:hypothetical protein